jgi:hypothetical protein
MTETNELFENLVAYAVGELNAEEVRSVERRLADSPSLRADLDAIRQFLKTMREDDTVMPQEHLIQRVLRIFDQNNVHNSSSTLERTGRFIAQLIFDSRAQPTLSGFRGRGEGYHLMYASEVGEVDLQVTRDSAASSKLLEIRGQVSAADAHPTLIHLARRGDEETIREAYTDQQGTFRFDTQPGWYDLRIEFAEKTLLVEDVHIE